MQSTTSASAVVARPDLHTVSLITGGASGIGKAVAEMMVRRGSKVVIGDMNVSGAKQVADELNKSAGDTVALAMGVDTASWDSQLELFAAGKKAFGRIDYVFANAGIGEDPFLPRELPTDSFVKPGEKTLAVNLHGQIYTSALAIQYFAKQPAGPHGFQGKLLITASVLGTFYLPEAMQYSTSKAAMLQFMCCAAERYEIEGITVNAICPNFVLTGIIPLGTFWEEMKEKHLLTPISYVVDAFESCVGDSKINGAALVCNQQGVYQHPIKNSERYKYEENRAPLEMSAKTFRLLGA